MDKRLLIFLLGFFVFFFAYQKFVLDPIAKKNRPAPQQQQQQPAPVVKKTPAPAEEVKDKRAEIVKDAESTAPASAENQIRVAVVDTPLYRAEFRNQGGVLSSFRLKKYLDDEGRPLEMIPQIPNKKELPLKMEFGEPTITSRAENALFLIDRHQISLNGKQADSLEMLYSDGIYVFKKVFKFQSDSYLIHARAEASSGGEPLPVRLSWNPGLENLTNYKKEKDLKPSKGIVNTGADVDRVDPKDTEQFQKIGATVRWAGVENNYFIGVFIPSNQPADAYMSQAENTLKKSIHNVDVVLAGQKAEPLEFSLFIGPKDYLQLRDIGMGLENSVSFGVFGPIAKVLFFALHYFYQYTHNYGWAIVLLTILIKILFTPLTQKSFVSMKKMQQMQPELKKIQEKYAKQKNDDPRKQNMNMEIMQLHKRYGVNPLSGCLPMLIQMPVLFAFYSLLSNSIELRKAPFIFWLNDLAQPDPYFVTPVLMGATMLLQQRMTPASDPMQQKMMYLMPIMFTWISFNLQSGLVLYWLLSNVLAIAHQYYFQRQQKVATARAAA